MVLRFSVYRVSDDEPWDGLTGGSRDWISGGTVISCVCIPPVDWCLFLTPMAEELASALSVGKKPSWKSKGLSLSTEMRSDEQDEGCTRVSRVLSELVFSKWSWGPCCWSVRSISDNARLLQTLESGVAGCLLMENGSYSVCWRFLIFWFLIMFFWSMR